MTDNVKKTSELATSNAVAGSDRIVILKDPAGTPSTRTITTNNFAESIKSLVQNIIPNTTVIANSITLASNGTNNVEFVSYTIGSGKTGCSDITLHAHSTDFNSVTAAHILTVANNSDVSSSTTSIEVGDNQILFNANPTKTANTIKLYFSRSSAATDNVTIRYVITVY